MKEKIEDQYKGLSTSFTSFPDENITDPKSYLKALPFMK